MDSFNDIGFLSPDLNGWMTEARKDFEAGFDAAEAVNRLAMKVLYNLPAENMTAAHVLANACYGRALQSFQGVILLAKRGMPVESLTLVRSCTESVIALAALKVDQTMPEQMEESFDYHQKSHANAILQLKKEDDELKQIIESINKKYAPGKPQQIKWEPIADKTGLIELYASVYRHASTEAHPTKKALERHIKLDTEGKPTGFEFGPDKSGLSLALHFACAVMMQAIELSINQYNLSKHRNELSGCLEKLKKLSSTIRPHGQ